jgi:hypothetical protein
MPTKRPRMKGMAVPSGMSFIRNNGSIRSTLIRQRRTMLIMITRTIETAVNIEIAMPRPMVTAKPRTRPEPIMNRSAVAIRAVRFESTIVA